MKGYFNPKYFVMAMLDEFAVITRISRHRLMTFWYMKIIEFYFYYYGALFLKSLCFVTLVDLKE